MGSGPGGQKAAIAATKRARPDSVEFDEETVIDSDGILTLPGAPDSLDVVGIVLSPVRAWCDRGAGNFPNGLVSREVCADV